MKLRELPKVPVMDAVYLVLLDLLVLPENPEGLENPELLVSQEILESLLR